MDSRSHSWLMTGLDLEFESGILGFGSPALFLFCPGSACTTFQTPVWSWPDSFCHSAKAKQNKKTRNKRETIMQKAQLFHHDAGKKLPLITGASPQL